MKHIEYIVRALDGLWYVVEAKYPNVLTTLPYETHAEAFAAATMRTYDSWKETV